MLGDLSTDLMGTNPKFPPVANHDWLDVKVGEYDNYPSSNNAVRVIPELADQWNPFAKDSGLRLIPNQKEMTVTGMDQVKEDEKSKEMKAEIIRSAKKALMLGYSGKQASDYLKDRYNQKDLVACAEKLAEVSKEQGLMGNVYVDASAFKSINDAMSFLKTNVCKTAQFILIPEGFINVGALQSVFKKQAVSKIDYTPEVLKAYKDVLVFAGKIPADYVMDSKEALRKAFLHKEVTPVEPVKVHEAPEELNVEAAEKELGNRKELHASSAKQAEMSLHFNSIRSIVKCAQENVSEGKDFQSIKGILRSKFAAGDIKKAASYLSIIASEQGLTASHISELEASGEICTDVAKELRRLALKYPTPVRYNIKGGRVIEKQAGVPGYLANPGNTLGLLEESNPSPFKVKSASVNTGFKKTELFIETTPHKNSSEIEVGDMYQTSAIDEALK